MVKNELDILLEHNDVSSRPLPILFYANKIDKNNSMTPSEVQAALDLQRIEGREWKLQASNALEGIGLSEGINWLSEKTKNNKLK